MGVFYAVLFMAVMLAAAFVALFIRMASRRNVNCDPVEWLADFSAASYAPMERLLDERDFAFVASQAGYDARIVRQLRAERKQIFKGYLRRLVLDFNQLIAIAKLMVVYGADDQFEFAKSLWRYQVRFYSTICVLRCRLAFYPMIAGSLEVGHLVGVLERMRDGLNRLAAPAHAAAL